MFTRLKCYRMSMVHSNKNVAGGAMPNAKMSVDDRYTYLGIQFDRYREADRHGKNVLLTEMAAVTGMSAHPLDAQCAPSSPATQATVANLWG